MLSLLGGDAESVQFLAAPDASTHCTARPPAPRDTPVVAWAVPVQSCLDSLHLGVGVMMQEGEEEGRVRWICGCRPC